MTMLEKVTAAVDKCLDEQEGNRYWSEGIACVAIKAVRESADEMRRAEVLSLGVTKAYCDMIGSALDAEILLHHLTYTALVDKNANASKT